MKKIVSVIACFVVLMLLCGCVEDIVKPISSTPEVEITKEDLLAEYTKHEGEERSMSSDTHFKLSRRDGSTTESTEAHQFNAQKIDKDGKVTDFSYEYTTKSGKDEVTVSFTYTGGKFYANYGDANFVSDMTVDAFAGYLKDNMTSTDISADMFKKCEFIKGKDKEKHKLKFTEPEYDCISSCSEIITDMADIKGYEVDDVTAVTVEALFDDDVKLSEIDITVSGKDKEGCELILTSVISNIKEDPTVSVPKNPEKYKKVKSAECYPDIILAMSNYMTAAKQKLRVHSNSSIDNCPHPVGGYSTEEFSYSWNDDKCTFKYYYDLQNKCYLEYKSGNLVNHVGAYGSQKAEEFSEAEAQAFLNSVLLLGYIDISQATDFSVVDRGDGTYIAQFIMKPSWATDKLNELSEYNETGHAEFKSVDSCDVSITYDNDKNIKKISYSIVAPDAHTDMEITVE